MTLSLCLAQDTSDPGTLPCKQGKSASQSCGTPPARLWITEQLPSPFPVFLHDLVKEGMTPNLFTGSQKVTMLLLPSLSAPDLSPLQRRSCGQVSCLLTALLLDAVAMNKATLCKALETPKHSPAAS